MDIPVPALTLRIGVDIGGTFTDVVLVDERGDVFQTGKVLTSADDPVTSVIAGIEELLAASGVGAERVSHVVHGTTLLTNALIERTGPTTGLITTAGFRDILEIAREHRYDLYDLFMERPEPLVPRRLRLEVPERVLADGTVRQPLDREQATVIVDGLVAAGVEAVAICLLHSYQNPTHERALGEIIGERAKDIAWSLSCEVVPEIREYERTSTTVANVYVKALAGSYLGRLEESLDGTGVRGDLFVMQSNGGVCTVETATRFPIRLVESGPAAGALAAAHYGRLAGRSDLLSFDMGGTTAKACLIEDGKPLVASSFEVARVYRFKKGSGLPIRVPVIEMIEIGAGGGSIARVGELGLLEVGPDSAGADPGPACYGLGGAEPTVTDADLALGYLDPEFFLGGRMRLDRDAALDAIARGVAEPMGLDPVRAAWGIHQVVNENMASAARVHAVERGKDIRRFPLFAFGGAGPVHADRVARILRSPGVICPLGAGVTSAVGFLAAPLAFDFVRTLPGELAGLDWSRVRGCLEEMEAEGRAILERTVRPDQIRYRRWAEMRYRKQGHEVRVPLPDEIGPGSETALRGAFEREYEAIYGHTSPDVAVEVVSWRVVAEGPAPELHLPTGNGTGTTSARARKGQRAIYVPEEEGFVEVPVYDRYRLGPGAEFEGAAVVEERESTVVVGPGAKARVDERLNLVIEPDLVGRKERSVT